MNTNEGTTITTEGSFDLTYTASGMRYQTWGAYFYTRTQFKLNKAITADKKFTINFTLMLSNTAGKKASNLQLRAGGYSYNAIADYNTS